MISETDSENRIARYQLAVALLLGGLITNAADVWVTLQAWVVESNAVVLALGPGPWIAVKAVLLVGLVACWWVGREHRFAPVVLIGPLLVGLFGLVGNASASGWHATEIGRGALAAAAVSLLVVAVGTVGLERLWNIADAVRRPPSLPGTRQQHQALGLAILMMASVPAATILLTQTGTDTNSGVVTADSASANIVYIGGNDNTVKAVYEDNGTVKWSFSGHSGAIIDVSTSPDGDIVYSLADDYLVKAIYAENGTEKWSYSGLNYEGKDIISSPNGKKLYILGSYDSTNNQETPLKVVHAKNGTGISSHEFHNRVEGISISKDGETLFLPGAKTTETDQVAALDSDTLDTIWTYPGTIYDLATSPDGETVYYANYAGEVGALNATDGTSEWTFTGHSSEVRGVAVSTDGNVVYSASYDNTVKAIYTANGTKKWSHTLPAAARDVAISGNGSLVFTSYGSGNLRALNADDGSQNYDQTPAGNTILSIESKYVYSNSDSGGSTGQTVNGTVENPTGDGYGGATVELINDSGTVIGTDTTAGNGSYSISGVSDGDYTLRVKSDDYDTTTRSVSVNGSSVTVDVRLGYQQNVELNDPRDLFKPYDPVVTVYRWDKVDVPTSSPSTDKGWTKTQSRTISWDGDVQLGMADGEFYALVLEVDHSEEVNGSAEATIFGYVGNSSAGTLTWDVSEPESESDSPVVASVSQDTARVVYDGPPVSELNYSVREGNETLNRSLSFDEPRSYYETQVQLGNTGSNISDPESVSYSGVYGNGSTFNGSSQFEAANFSSFGPVSGGGGGGPPLSPLLATTGIAAAGLLLYSRSSGRSLGEIASGAGKAIRRLTGRGR